MTMHVLRSNGAQFLEKQNCKIKFYVLSLRCFPTKFALSLNCQLTVQISEMDVSLLCRAIED